MMGSDYGTYFPFFASDFLADQHVSALSLEAQAVLVRCWCVCCRDGYLPPGCREMATAIGVNPRTVRAFWPEIGKFFRYASALPDEDPLATVNRDFELNSSPIRAEFSPNGVWYSRRIEKNRRRLLDLKEKKSKAANHRWDKAKNETYHDAGALLDMGGSGDAGACPSGDAIKLKIKKRIPEGVDAKGDSSPIPPRSRTRKRQVVSTWLRPESEEAFEWIWSHWTPTIRKNGTVGIERGDRLPAERCFQTIVDDGAATVEELWQAAELYLTKHPKVLEGYTSFVATFFALEGGRWAEGVRTVRAYKAQQLKQQQEQEQQAALQELSHAE